MCTVDIEGEQAEFPDARPARSEDEPRRTYLKKGNFERHGYSEGCEGCRRPRAENMAARAHTKECRDGMGKILEEENNPR